MKSKELGSLGERIACQYLKNKGYKILDKNYSPHYISGPKRGEIDIIAKKGDVISFIEVKTLTNRERFSGISPEEKVNSLKKRKIIKTAENWLAKRKILLNSKWRVDVISIKINLENKKAKIRHFYNV